MRLLTLVAVAVMVPGGCATTTPPPHANFRCPVTSGVVADTADQSFTNVVGVAFGTGPVFAIINGATADRIPFPTPWPDGVYAQKVPWISRPAYKGNVSVRGQRLDAGGQALFGWGVPPDMTTLAWQFPGINGNFQPASAARALV